MDTRSLTRIAIFPIPGCVCFPGTTVPLHVFEPRYRVMVRDCIERDMPMGICHTQKRIHKGKDDQPLEEALRSNQDTYKPHEVFSAGRCELVKTLDDGRLLINVHLDGRYRSVSEEQTLPYSIHACEPYVDSPASEAEQIEARQLKDKIIHRITALTQSIPNAREVIEACDRENAEPGQFGFQMLSWLRFDPDLQQLVLEQDSAVIRLQVLLDLLNQD